MSIRISKTKDHYISVYQARCDTSIVDRYFDTATVKTSSNVYKNTLKSDMIFTKDNESNSDEQVEKLTREFSIHYSACTG